MKIGPVKGKALLVVEGASEVSVKAVERAILAILGAPHADESTKQVALQTLGRLVPSNVSISNSTFTGPV